LNFGLDLQTNFTKHPFAVKSVKFSRFGLYASLDDKNLILFDRAGKQRLSINYFEHAKVHIVTCFAYITRYRVYIVVTADFRMFIMSDYFDIIRVMQLGSGRVQGVEYLEDTDELLFCGINSLIVKRLNILAKYDIESAIMLDPTGRSMNISLTDGKQIETGLHWIRGFKIQLPNAIFWSEGDISLVNLETHEATMQLRDLSPNTSITTVILSLRFQTFAVGTFIGGVFLYKSASHTRLIHTFEAHSRPVLALSPHPDTTMFLSAASDFTIKVWSYDKFAMIYCFAVTERPPQPLTEIIFLSLTTVVLCFEARVAVSKLNFLADFFALLKSPIRRVQALGHRVGVLCEDNSCAMFDSEGMSSCTIFPPPGALAVLAFDYVPELNRVVMLLDSGSVVIIRCVTDTGILEKIINIGDIMASSRQDTSGVKVQSAVTALKVVRGHFPIYDPEIALKTVNPKNARVFTEHQFKSNAFLAVAAGKGALILLHTDHLQTVYTRYAAHREQIVTVEQVGQRLLTLCEQHRLIVQSKQIAGHDQEQMFILQKIDLRQPLGHLVPLTEHSFLMTFPVGDTEVFKFTAEGLVRMDYASDSEHEIGIASVSVEGASRLIATAANDSIKLLTFDKQIQEEIKYVDSVAAVCFFQGSLLVAHKSTISKVKSEAFSTKPYPSAVTAAEFEVHDVLWQDTATELYGGKHTEVTNRSNSETRGHSSFEVKTVDYRRKANIKVDEELGIDEQTWNDAVHLYERKKAGASPLINRDAGNQSNLKRAGQRKKQRSVRKPKRIESAPKKKHFEQPPKKRLEIEAKHTEEYIKAITVPIRSQSPKKRDQPATVYTRRQLTEEKIIANVLRFGDPADRVDTRGLCVDMEPPEDEGSVE
jgi:WD40 repeat protein